MTTRCILPLALMLATSVAHGAPAFVARSATNDIPQQPLVSLSVTAAAGTICHAYEEFLPASVAVTNVTGGGVWLPDQRVIRWGPFTATPVVQFTYRLTGPPGTHVPGGRLSADGSWSFTPVEIPVTIAAASGDEYPVRPGTVAKPLITPAGSTSLPVTVTMSCSTPGAVVRYTTDGTAPSALSTLYTGAVQVATATLIRAAGFAPDSFPSEVRNAWFAVKAPQPTLETTRSVVTNTPWLPEISIAATQMTGALCWAYEEILPPGLTVSGITENGVFDPTNRLVKWGPFTGRSSATMSYQASGSAGTYSVEGRWSVDGYSTEETASYMIAVASAPGSGDDYPVRPGTVAKPLITPAGSTTLPVTVTMSCSTPGAGVRYTTDGTAPSALSTLYTGSVPVATATLIRAAGFAPDSFPSEVRNAWFAVKAPQPTLETTRSVVTNTPWLPEVSIMATQMTGALCWAYEDILPPGLTVSGITENGVFDPTNRLVKWGPFTGRSSATMSYQASGSAGTYSVQGRWSVNGYSTEETASCVIAVASAPGGGDDYPVRPPTVARPVITVTGGPSLPVSVAVSCATSGAILRYTLDGTAPTVASALYTGSLDFTSNTVLRIRAFVGGLEASPITNGYYATATPLAPLVVSRTISANNTPSPAIELLVVPPSRVKSHALTESIPAGLTPHSISHSGVWDDTNRMVKWGPFPGTGAVRLTYMLSGMPGMYRLEGAGSADGLGSVTTGPDMVTMAAQDELPDLVPAVVSFERASAVTYSVMNSGRGVAMAHWTDRWYDTFYLSQNSILDSGDTMVGSFIGNSGLSLAAGATYTVTNNLSLPEISGGNYYLILKTDERGLVNETNKANNTVAIPITLPTLASTPDRVLVMPADGGGGTSVVSAGDLAFSPDGVRLAVASGSRVAMWNLQSHATASNALLGTFIGHGAAVSTVQFSPANDEVLSGSRDGTIRIWDGRTFSEARRIATPSGEPCPAVFSPDGAMVLGGDTRGIARIWDAVTRNVLRTLTGHSASVTAVAFSRDGTRALTGGSDKKAILWDVATGAILYQWTSHTQIVNAVAISPDDTRALTADGNGVIRIWNTQTGAAVSVLQQGRPLSDAVFSPDGLYIAAADRGLPGMAYLWEVGSGRVVQMFRPANVAPSTIEGVAFSPDRATIATGHSDGNIRLWESGLTAIPIHTVVALPVGVDLPVTMQSHGLYYFEIDVPADHSLVVTVDAAGGGGGASAKLSLAGLGAPKLGALSSDVRFANRAPSQESAQAGLMQTQAISDFPPDADIEAFRVLATREHLPSVYEYDHYAQAYVSNLHAEVPLSANAANKCYVLVFAPWLAAGVINATIRAEFTTLHLSGISHKQGGNAGSITVQLRGTGFGLNTVTMLTSSESAVITGEPVYPPDTTEMTLRFDLRSAVAGAYDILVLDGGEIASIPKGFEIVDGGAGDPEIELGGPSAIRFGRSGTFTVTVGNPGLTDLEDVAVLFRIVGLDPAIQPPAEGWPTYFFYQSSVAPGYQASFPMEIPGILSPQCYRPEQIYLGVEQADNCNTLATKIDLVLEQIKAIESAIIRLTQEIAELKDFKEKVCEDFVNQLEKEACKAACDFGIHRREQLKEKLKVELGKLEASKARLCAAMGAIPCKNTPPECAGGAGSAPAPASIPAPAASSSEPGGGSSLLPQSGIVLSDADWAALSDGKAGLRKDAPKAPKTPTPDFCVVRSYDPNDKIGPLGVGPDRLISSQDAMDYMIRFENFATATAPVQELVVVDYLDSNLDWSTVEFGEIRYGDRVIAVPSGQLNFSTRDLPPTSSIAITGITVGQLAVDITATFNPQNGRLEWRMVARDTQDNQYPDDALAGFLPPNNADTHCGEGQVTFRVKPKLGLALGTRIENKAAIVFDSNDVVETPTVFNTIGQVEPKLAARIAAHASELHLGEPFAFSLTLSNSGINAATGIAVINALPAGFEFVSATATAGTVTHAAGVMTWDIDSISNGVPVTANVTLRPTQEGDIVLPVIIGGSNISVTDVYQRFTIGLPKIGIRKATEGTIEVFAPSVATSYIFETCDDLSHWVPVADTPFIRGDLKIISITPSNHRTFFRLRKQ